MPLFHPRIHIAKHEATRMFLPYDGVYGVGIHPSGEKIHLYLQDESFLDQFGSVVQGFEIIPIETQPFQALTTASFDPTSEIRPAFGGVSISNSTCACAGTLGSAVFDFSSKQMMLISNNHVLALNDPASIGSAIYQPAQYDGGGSADTLATVTRFGTISTTAMNLADWAVGTPTSPGNLTTGIYGIGTVQDIIDPIPNMSVIASGRNGLSSSKIQDIDGTLKVIGFPWGDSVFDHQIIMSAFATAGQSGALLVDESTLAAVGLISAGSQSLTIANLMSVVANQANVTLAKGASMPKIPVYASAPSISPIVGVAGVLGLGAFLASLAYFSR